MKGHVLGDVEGMWRWREIHQVQLLRPLLQCRKAHFVQLLEEFPTPHFRDSTPGWSVRGSTRAALDSIPDGTSHEQLIVNLQRFGRLSAEVGKELDSAIELWTERSVHPLQIAKGAQILALNLSELLQLRLAERVAEVEQVIEEIRNVWNPLVVEGGFKAISCIPESDIADIKWLLFEKGFFAAAESLLLGYLHLTEPCQVLVLYDALAQPTVDFKTLRQSMANAVRRALEKRDATTNRLELVVKSTTMIQANWRGKVRRRMFIAIRLFVRHVQALLRSKQARCDLLQRRCEDSATKIQAHARSVLAKAKYQSIRKKVIKLQALWHGVLGRRYAKEYKNHVSATKIQSLVRKQKEQKIYDALRASIVFAQQRLRMRNAKNQLKKLKQEAKEVGAMMAKAQKAAEQATELRKHNEELEAHQLQLQSENKTLTQKVKQLEETLQTMQHQFEEMRAQAAEAAKLAADNSKTVIEAEKLEAMNKQMTERDSELDSLRSELQSMKETHAKQQEQLKSAEANYQQLLRSTTMQSVGAGAGASAHGSGSRGHGSGSRGHRNVFIQLELDAVDGLDGLDASRDVQADVLHAFRLLETQSAQRPQRQTATEQTDTMAAVVVEGLLHPRWPQKGLERPLQHPVRVAYGTASTGDPKTARKFVMTLLALIFSLTHLLNGVRSSFVFAGLLMVLALVGLVDHIDIVTGFARWGCPGTAFVGATTAITTATPVIIQWAKSHSFKLRPLLLLMVVAATCGNSVFVTSSPSSIAIRDILCVTNCELKSQAFLALANAAILGLYVVIIGEFLAKKDQGPSRREARFGVGTAGEMTWRITPPTLW
eukprot:s42_g40.t2